MVIFGIEDVPEMTRGRGVRLQRYKEKGLSDVTTFKADDGLTWIDAAGRSFTLIGEGAEATGAASAPTPAASRRKAFRKTTSSAAC